MRHILSLSALLLVLAVLGGGNAYAAMRDCYFTPSGDFICVRSGDSPYENLPSKINKKDIMPRVKVPDRDPTIKPFVPPAGMAQDMRLVYTWPDDAECLESGEIDYEDLLKAAMATNPGLGEDVAKGDMPKFICRSILPEVEEESSPHPHDRSP